MPDETRHEALAAFEVARAGLLRDDERRTLQPAPALCALCRVLEIDLGPFMARDFLLDERSLLGLLACDLVAESFPLDEAEAAMLDELPRNHGVAESARLAVRSAIEPIVEQVRDVLAHALVVVAGSAYRDQQRDAVLERKRLAVATANLIDLYLEENPE